MTERAFWRRLKAAHPWDWAVRIESRTSPGSPDVCFSTNGIMGWLELKVSDAQRPLAGAFRPAQWAWHAEAQKHSVFAHCLLFSENQGILLPAVDLRVLARMSREDLMGVALWVGGRTAQTRFSGLRTKLEQTGETLRLATTCRSGQR